MKLSIHKIACDHFFNTPFLSVVIDTTQTGRLDIAEVLKPFKEMRQSLKLGNLSASL